MRIFKLLSCSLLLMAGMLSCEDDTLDFERIDDFEIGEAHLPLKGYVGDSLHFSFSASNSLSAIIERLTGRGDFFLSGKLLETEDLNAVFIGNSASVNTLVYVPSESGRHSGRVILVNSSLQRDTVAYDIAVEKNIPDFNARVHLDSGTNKYILYLKQQSGEEVPGASYFLQVKGDNTAELRINLAGDTAAYRVGDMIPMKYAAFMQNGYTLPIDLELITTTQDAYAVDFVIVDENGKTVTIKKTMNFKQAEDDMPVAVDLQPVVPDFNTRIFTGSDSEFNINFKQQGSNEVSQVEYNVYLEAGLNDDDVEMEIYFAESDVPYRLGDIINVKYSVLQKNHYVLPFEIKVVEASLKIHY